MANSRQSTTNNVDKMMTTAPKYRVELSYTGISKVSTSVAGVLFVPSVILARCVGFVPGRYGRSGGAASPSPSEIEN